MGRNLDAVLDHHRRRVAVVPHQVVEVRDVDDEDVRIVHRMVSLGRLLARWVVFQEDARKSPLLLRQHAVLVGEPVIMRLEEHAVDVDVLDVVDADLVHVLRPRK